MTKRGDKEKKKTKKDKHGHSFNGLTIIQKKIMKLVIEKNRTLTQIQVQDELKIPRAFVAFVSRNVRSFELMGLIEKDKSGISNMIRLKE